MMKKNESKKRGLSASLALVLMLTFGIRAQAQVNSGSDGSDGAFNPTTNIVIDMTDHPDGIYHYTSVNIPAGVTVTFKPNAANTPLVWLVQGNCVIAGVVSLDGQVYNGAIGGLGGPGGWRGGNRGPSIPGEDGQGPGGGKATTVFPSGHGGNASFGTVGVQGTYDESPGEAYGSIFLIPLMGGSGGGAGSSSYNSGGGGGGGAIVIAADTITVSGTVRANGGDRADGGGSSGYGGGAGSGGAIRLIASTISGQGSLSVRGGLLYTTEEGGRGRIRLDGADITFSGGTTSGVTSFGFQPIIIPPPSQNVGLSIESIGGVAIAGSPSGSPVNPDVIVPANTSNPVTIVVKCINIPLNTEVIIDAKPANGETVRAVAFNNSGTQSLSYATVQLSLPRGAGTIQAKAISGIADQFAAVGPAESETMLAQTGWLATGERFKAIEITSVLGGGQSIAYISESGKRYSIAQ